MLVNMRLVGRRHDRPGKWLDRTIESSESLGNKAFNKQDMKRVHKILRITTHSGGSRAKTVPQTSLSTRRFWPKLQILWDAKKFYGLLLAIHEMMGILILHTGTQYSSAG